MAEPTDVGAVKVALATPDEFVVQGPALSVPALVVTKMDRLGTVLPLTSLAVTVIVDELDPSAVTVVGNATTVDCAAVGVPGCTVNDGDVPVKAEVVAVMVPLPPAVVDVL